MVTIHDPSTLKPQGVIAVNRFLTLLLVQYVDSNLVELCLLNEDLQSDSGWPHLKRNLKLATGSLLSSVRRVESCDLFALRPWIVLDHCSGGSLRNRLQNEPLSENEIRKTAGTIAGVLMELQRLGCVCGTISNDTVLFRTPDICVLDITGLSLLSEVGEVCRGVPHE